MEDQKTTETESNSVGRNPEIDGRKTHTEAKLDG